MRNNIITGIIVFTVCIYFFILYGLYTTGANWEWWIYLGLPLVALKCWKCVLLIQCQDGEYEQRMQEKYNQEKLKQN